MLVKRVPERSLTVNFDIAGDDFIDTFIYERYFLLFPTLELFFVKVSKGWLADNFGRRVGKLTGGRGCKGNDRFTMGKTPQIPSTLHNRVLPFKGGTR